ncbi:MAG: hypothetical protein QF915_02650 [Candidatus Woesearchaeota archaeon]|jgi:plastocyanin|nr:hypothetical protein [Candidatus Woesearchaeota archaeon]MDP7458235.1 hypothetical protein [Candidatus Woesearchaeota archaeon]
MKKYILLLIIVLVLMGCEPVATQDDGHTDDDHEDGAEDHDDDSEDSAAAAVDDSGDAGDAASAIVSSAIQEVRLADKVAEPDTLTVSVGSTVVFINSGNKNQQLAGDVKSALLKPGERFEQIFDEAGTFNYIVIPLNYRGEIVVQ